MASLSNSAEAGSAYVIILKLSRLDIYGKHYGVHLAPLGINNSTPGLGVRWA